NRIAQTTTFNGQHLLDGTLGGQNFQVGANAGELITANGTNFQTHVYGGNRVYSKANDAASITPATYKDDGGKAVIDTPAKFPGLTDKITVAGRLGSSSEIDLSGKSAKEAAALVNAQTGKTGVTASAKTEALFTAAAGKSYSFKINSNNSDAVPISFTIGSNLDADGYAEAINAFNAQTAKTGVSAEYSEDLGGIKLTNAAGESINLVQDVGDSKTATLASIQYDSNTDKATVGTAKEFEIATAAAPADPDNPTAAELTAIAAAEAKASLGVVGTITFDSQSGFNIKTTAAATATDFAATANSSKLKTVASLDVSAFDKAQLAIAICDAAINTIDKEMARYGALQSRFNSTISNLEVNAENTSNARSRIQDADYAAETAELSRTTILQQAGTAMLAQANQRPQTVLSLLG
ncbi:MAG: hypothetical protein NC211_08550, partial [Alistipes senegalensis]|nr:flagellin [Oxalobacter formigenes]MCM1281856.1 hypothetical protein [Alistipes senegalensis]